MRIIISARAQHEFEHAVGYLLEQSPPSAVAFYDTIVGVFESLKQNPRRGARFGAAPLRRIVLTNFRYIVLYDLNETTIEVLSIFNTDQNPDKLPG
ncbi:MAG: type II toxin-antitoxin system RelE/ParE family toxin [Chloroflexi bacterium]|nr:type II toxin-antitoxin system RelE/ParE family toxin [Chloroflexota bacterium]